MIRKTIVLLAAGIVIQSSASAFGQETDWPCMQRLVVTLEAGSYWTGPVPQHTAWRDDETLFPLVTAAIDRDTPEAEGAAKLSAYVASIPQEQRKTAIPALFSALTDQTNDVRDTLVKRLEHLGRRQRGMGTTIAALSNRIDTLKDNDPDRETMNGERDFDVRAFQDTQHSVRYACEAPGTMERRLGSYARLLMAAEKR